MSIGVAIIIIGGVGLLAFLLSSIRQRKLFILSGVIAISSVAILAVLPSRYFGKIDLVKSIRIENVRSVILRPVSSNHRQELTDSTIVVTGQSQISEIMHHLSNVHFYRSNRFSTAWQTQLIILTGTSDSLKMRIIRIEGDTEIELNGKSYLKEDLGITLEKVADFSTKQK